MATVQDTIGAAIGDVILTFSSVTMHAAEYGNTWADVQHHAEGGRALVIPLGAAYSPDRSYSTERLVEFAYDVRFTIAGRGTKAVDYAGIVAELRSKFAPSSRTLQTAVAALSSLSQPTRATVIARVDDPLLEREEMTANPDYNNFSVVVRAETFVTL